ncbi:uncharacterized protein GIQ15_02620 [Arthroderma uncinatum]|uniref:uncharacterized protein n=1 Tax=Arthroderma uncinatum TaxID=74035 RepID=UPI00144AC527|nr:uncharacterized protein GIQ15_02620 [Arthroderma uncinatum]KAF3483296.1 hypothetical protein GIQ15_02620 [Arthroderma uncinatum]
MAEPKEGLDPLIEALPPATDYLTYLTLVEYQLTPARLPILHQVLQDETLTINIGWDLAVLEAYTEFPSTETTAAILELLRDISGKKRPRLPPRSASEQALTRPTGDTAAPDPEADEHVEGESTDATNEKRLTQRLLQFGLIETLKTYLLQCVDEPAPSGMQWALRMQEKLDPPRIQSRVATCIEQFQNTEHLKERDTTLGKIVALSRDFGLETRDLQQIIFKGENDHPPPLDFENVPKSPDDIPLERHGCILLLAARCVTVTLFGSGARDYDLLLYPDIVNILLNFLGDYESPYTAAAQEPTALIDSILSLAAVAKTSTSEQDTDEEGFKTLVYGLTACARGPTQFRAFTRLGSIPARAFHAYPDIQVRYNLILEILNEEESEYARLSALQWLKEELISYSTTLEDTDSGNPFSDPESFTFLFQSIYKFSHPVQSSPPSNVPEGITPRIWMEFVQEFAPLYLAKLNFYYFLCKSPKLAEQLHIDTLLSIFDSKFLTPLKSFVSCLSENPAVSSHIEAELGDAAVQMGRNAASVVLQIISDVTALA